MIINNNNNASAGGNDDLYRADEYLEFVVSTVTINSSEVSTTANTEKSVGSFTLPYDASVTITSTCRTTNTNYASGVRIYKNGTLIDDQATKYPSYVSLTSTISASAGDVLDVRLYAATSTTGYNNSSVISY